MRKEKVGKKFITKALLDLSEGLIRCANHPDTDEAGARYAHAHATFLLELAKRELK